jgi:hypothetical protein
VFFRRILPCLLAVTIPACAASAPSFLTAKTFSVGKYGYSNPVSVAGADLNGDGRPDLVVANQGFGFLHVQGYLAVLLGNGDGTFQPAVEYQAGGVPEFVTVADLNNDGKLDIIVANFGSNNVSVLLGNGDGTFQNHMDFGTVNAPTSLAIGDFNNDGKLDVASTDADPTMSTRGSVAVLLGNGDGTLQPAVSSPAGGDIQYIAAGDFNGDGIPDLAVANKQRSSFAGNLAILFGKGDGTFQSPVKYLNHYSLSVVVAADFNNDGILDIVTNDGVLVLGKGDGTFGSPITIPVFGSIAIGDLNGDGKLDVAATQGTYVNVFYGSGDGTFQTGPAYYGGGSDSTSSAIADFNGDHHLDLAVTNKVDANVAILLAKSQSVGQFRSPSIYLNTGVLAFADFNGDHLPDMASVSYVTYEVNQLQIFLGNGDGTFQTPTNYSPAQNPNWVVTGDFNHDGKVDVALGVSDLNCANPAIIVMLGNGNGTFGNPVSYSAGACTNFIGTADINHDGKLDLIALGSVLLGNGDGTFQSPITFSAGSQPPTSFVVGDFNNDGKQDLFVEFYSSYSVALLLGNGDGTFQSPLVAALGGSVYAIAAADLNADGNLDVILTTQYTSTQSAVTILLGNGNGTFGKRMNYPLGIEFGYGVTIADLNRDGVLDVAAVGYGSTLDTTGDLLILLGNGDGTLQAPLAMSIGNPFAVITTDLNQDGVPDVVVSNGGATVFLNTTP